MSSALSELQDLWLLPTELLPTKVTVAGCFLVERTLEIQVPRTQSNQPKVSYNHCILYTIDLPDTVRMGGASPAGLQGHVWLQWVVGFIAR